MFTGIVVEQGRILEAEHQSEGPRIRIGCKDLLGQLRVSDSISIDGCCLTVVAKDAESFSVDATPETMRLTNLGSRRPGDRVNLEPAARVSDFLGGHLVQGHVDQKGRVESVREDGNSRVFRFSAPQSVLTYSVLKGSIAVNGVSLTISGLGEGFFEVTIIPHTLEITNFGSLEPGDFVNLEVDVISKYVEAHVRRITGTLASFCLALLFSFGMLQAQQLELSGNSVLVFGNETRENRSQFVVRIARHLPDLVMEWESESDQGTVQLTRSAVESGQDFTLNQLYEVGVDNISRKIMTLRLSDWAFRELTGKGLVKLRVNRVPAKLQLIGKTLVKLKIGGKPTELEALEVADDRRGEWLILNDANAPLILRYQTPHFTQELRSVAHPESSSLRWIKKLPPVR